MQKYDWMKHLTDAEMQQMKADNWDVEDVELGPISERYLQPSLQFDPEEYAKALSQGREASRLVDLYNNGGNVRSLPAFYFCASCLPPLAGCYFLLILTTLCVDMACCQNDISALPSSECCTLVVLVLNLCANFSLLYRPSGTVLAGVRRRPSADIQQCRAAGAGIR